MTAAKSRSRRTSPTEKELRAAANNWSDAVLVCRTLMHSWRQYHAELHKRVGRNASYWTVYYECTRGCGVQRHEEWDMRGLVVRKNMHYPTDDTGQPLYLLVGFGRVTGELRGVIRLESVQRTGYDEVDEKNGNGE
jgi:hypothetical protein